MRLFGTNGIRGRIGEEFKPDFLVKVGLALGSYLNRGSTVIVGRDTRVSGEMVKNAVISGLLAAGINVVDIGVAPTPAIQFYTKNHGDFGIAITASHNPPEFNGIKAIAGDGTELPRVEEEKIENIYLSGNFRVVGWDEVGRYFTAENANEEYLNAIMHLVDVDLIRKKRFRVVIDCSNGASSLTTPYLLRKLGCHVVSLNCQPDGRFPGHESEPKPENLKDLIEFMRAGNFDLGIAHDGDADRAIFVDENGRFIHGDRTLALVVREIVSEKKGIVVTPVSSSMAVEDVVKENGGRIIYTKVGAPIVARKMLEVGAIFGGEENGGLIFPEMQYCRDGAMAVAKILEIIAKKGLPFSKLIDSLPRYYQKKITVRCEESKKKKVLEKLVEMFKNENIITLDGVKIIHEDYWVLIRPSGTEPIYRIYAEAKSQEKLEEVVEKYRKVVEEIIGEVDALSHKSGVDRKG